MQNISVPTPTPNRKYTGAPLVLFISIFLIQCCQTKSPKYLFLYYNRLSLSRLRLSRITAYFKVKIWSLYFQHVTKYCGKEEKLLLRSKFSYFPQHFQYISNLMSQITYSFVKCGCLIYFFLNSTNLICWGREISKYFRESLGLWDNESPLYFYTVYTALNTGVAW